MHVQVSLMIEISASASLQDLEEQIQQAGRVSMRQALVKSIRAWEEQHRRCPNCGSVTLRVEGSIRRMLGALFGRVSLGLRRFRCQNCLHRWCPARELFRSLQHKQISVPLRTAAVLAGASWPYRHAAAVLERWCGASISAEELRLLTNEQGQQHACTQQQRADAAADPLLVAPTSMTSSSCWQPTSQQQEVIGLDGGWIASREQRGGMEGKVAVLATCKEVAPSLPRADPSTLTWYELAKAARQGRRVGPVHQRARYRKRRYCATFASSHHLGRQAAQAAREMELHGSVVVGDGAQWIKKEAQLHFPQATAILDWPHLWRVIRKAITETALLEQKSSVWKKAQSQQISQWLWRGNVELASARLQSWPSQGKAVKAALTYLREQRSWIGDYEQWKQQGYPIGSGIIERAVSLVINRRMKKRGMRWKRVNATSVVALRVDFLNTDWQMLPQQRAFP